MFADPARVGGHVPAHPVIGATVIGEDPLQGLDDRLVRPAPEYRRRGVTEAALLFGLENVDPALHQAASVREVDLFLVGLRPADPDLVQGQAVDPVQVTRRENPVDPPTSTGHELGHGSSSAANGTHRCARPAPEDYREASTSV
jgi:hypothetical protein